MGGGGEVEVLSGSCGNQEDWIEMLTYEETCRQEGGRNVIFKALCDGFLIRAEGQASNGRQCCVKLQ